MCPASTTTEALALLGQQEVRAAILDVNLADRDVEPVLSRCVAAGRAIVIHTGTQLPDHLASPFPAIVVLTKPSIPDDVVAALKAVIADAVCALVGGIRRGSRAWPTHVRARVVSPSRLALGPLLRHRMPGSKLRTRANHAGNAARQENAYQQTCDLVVGLPE